VHLPRPLLIALWVLVCLGGADVLVAVVGLVLTRSPELLPMLVVGLGELSVSVLLLWALTRVAQ
jgi:hypothetical protein